MITQIPHTFGRTWYKVQLAHFGRKETVEEKKQIYSSVTKALQVSDITKEKKVVCIFSLPDSSQNKAVFSGIREEVLNFSVVNTM